MQHKRGWPGRGFWHRHIAAAITYTACPRAGRRSRGYKQKTIYGGSYNLLEHTLSQFGVETTFVDAQPRRGEVPSKRKPLSFTWKRSATRTPISPTSTPFPEIAKKHHGLPVLVDNTFGTPYLFRPLEHGANSVHSATKFIGDHGTSLSAA